MKAAILLILIFVFAPCNANALVVVEKKLIADLAKYNVVFIDAINATYKSADGYRVGSEEVSIKGEISNALNEIGIDTIYDQGNAKLKVECHFTHGWGIPRIIRHFKIKAKYITTVNIKFIDLPTKEIIGEVEYKRPWSKTNPTDFIKMMIDKLVESREVKDKKPDETK